MESDGTAAKRSTPGSRQTLRKQDPEHYLSSTNPPPARHVDLSSGEGGKQRWQRRDCVIKRAPGRRSNKKQGLQVGVRSILCRDLTEATCGEHVQLLPSLLILYARAAEAERGTMARLAQRLSLADSDLATGQRIYTRGELPMSAPC